MAMKLIGSTIKSQFQKRKVFLLVVAVFWFCILFIKDPINLGEDYDVEKGYAGDTPSGAVGEITSDTILEQTFFAEYDGLQEISLYMATYARVNHGTITVKITNSESQSILYEETLAMDGFADNSWRSFSFDKQTDSKGNVYVIQISSDNASAGNAITMYYSGDELMDDATINGQAIDGALCLKAGYVVDYLKYVRLAMWCAVILITLLFALFIDKADEKMFLRYALVFGGLMIIINPFVHVLDESTHFFRSYMISQGDFVDEVDESGNIGGYVADNYGTIVENQLSIKSYLLDKDIWNARFSDEKEFYRNPYMSSVTPFNHAVAAIGIFIGRLLRLPAVLVIILGRVCTLAFYTVFSYLAIREAKYYKNIFFIVAALPMGIWLAGSYTIDPILINAALLFTSICLKYYLGCEEQIKTSELVLLLICGISIATVKYLVYTPILLLFFLIPRKSFSKKQYIVELCLAVIIVVLAAGMQFKMLGMFEFTEDRNGDVDVARQVSYMAGHIVTTLRNFADYSFENVWVHMQGMVSLYSAFPAVSLLVGMMLILGAPLDVHKYDFTEEKKKQKCLLALCLIIFLIVSALTIAALYVGFTPVGKYAVEGVQPCYFIPVLIFVMIPMTFWNVQNNIRNFEVKISELMELGMINMLAAVMTLGW